MSTPATISTVDECGLVKTVYLHWDGYPEHAGAILKTHYTTKELVNTLLEQGDVSVINETIEDSEFYKRDRDESDTEYRVYASVKEMLEEESHGYNYVFDDGEWLIYLG